MTEEQESILLHILYKLEEEVRICGTEEDIEECRQRIVRYVKALMWIGLVIE